MNRSFVTRVRGCRTRMASGQWIVSVLVNLLVVTVNDFYRSDSCMPVGGMGR